MKQKPAILIFFCAALLAFVGFSPDFSAAAVPVKPGEEVLRAAPLPHTELERQESSTGHIGLVTEKRQTFYFEQIRLQVSGKHFPVMSLEQNHACTLPVKDYLFHIYPSHHFW